MWTGRNFGIAVFGIFEFMAGVTVLASMGSGCLFGQPNP